MINPDFNKILAEAIARGKMVDDARPRFAFDMYVCIESGTVDGHKFERGEIYPVMDYTNGVNIMYGRKELVCHTIGDVVAPVEGKQFVHQDGTVPPLFRGAVIEPTIGWRIK